MRRSKEDRVVVAGVLALLIVCVIVLALWFTGTTQRFLAARALDDFYAAIGRGDYATARGLARDTSEAELRAWAAVEGATHGPPVGARFVDARWGILGGNGFVSYLVRYQDGAEEHASHLVIVVFFWTQLPPPPHTLEQQLRDCYTPGAGTVTFGDARVLDTSGWALAYTAMRPDGARVSGTFFRGISYPGDVHTDFQSTRAESLKCQR